MTQNRYSRQILFAPIGEAGQKKLQESSIFIVGMGALGTVLASHMTRAGVGYVRYVDRDVVEYSNLQRQILFDESDAQEMIPKSIAAERKLKRINSDVQIEGIVDDLTSRNIAQYTEGMDLILDGTDNFQTRFLVNDYCFKHGIPYIYGGVVSSHGMQAAFIPGHTPCLRCFIDDAGGSSETCDTVGVIAPIVDIIASYQTVDAIKLLTGQYDQVRKSLMTLDVWYNRHQEIRWTSPKTNCPTCQTKEYPALDPANEDYIASLCGRETIQINPSVQTTFNLDEWEKRLQKVGDVQKNPFLLRCQLENLQLVLFPNGRVLIQGTEDPAVAKSVYSRYIGM